MIQFHPIANIFPMMTGDEFDALVADIAENGQREPIYTHDNQIIDGRNRYNACLKLGLKPILREWDGRGSLVSFVVSLNLHRRHLTSSQRAVIALDVLPMLEAEAKERQGERNDIREIVPESVEPQGKSTERAASLFSTNSHYVSDAKRIAAEAPEMVDAIRSGEMSIPEARRLLDEASPTVNIRRLGDPRPGTDADGVLVKGRVSPYRIKNGVKRCEVCGQLWGADLDYCPYCNISPAARQAYVQDQRRRVESQTIPPHVAHNAGNNEWYTPTEYIAAAIRVMGHIDLDPASTAEANSIVCASRFYTAEQNGLRHHWQGKVWMNPPYASEWVGQFAAKLAQHVRAGDVPEAIVLVNNATETNWFGALIAVAAAVCFPKGRVRFWEPGGALSAPLQGQAVIYIGPTPDVFRREFAAFGWSAAL